MQILLSSRLDRLLFHTLRGEGSSAGDSPDAGFSAVGALEGRAFAGAFPPSTKHYPNTLIITKETALDEQALAVCHYLARKVIPNTKPFVILRWVLRDGEKIAEPFDPERWDDEDGLTSFDVSTDHEYLSTKHGLSFDHTVLLQDAALHQLMVVLKTDYSLSLGGQTHLFCDLTSSGSEGSEHVFNTAYELGNLYEPLAKCLLKNHLKKIQYGDTLKLLLQSHPHFLVDSSIASALSGRLNNSVIFDIACRNPSIIEWVLIHFSTKLSKYDCIILQCFNRAYVLEIRAHLTQERLMEDKCSDSHLRYLLSHYAADGEVLWALHVHQPWIRSYFNFQQLDSLFNYADSSEVEALTETYAAIDKPYWPKEVEIFLARKRGGEKEFCKSFFSSIENPIYSLSSYEKNILAEHGLGFFTTWLSGKKLPSSMLDLIALLSSVSTEFAECVWQSCYRDDVLLGSLSDISLLCTLHYEYARHYLVLSKIESSRNKNRFALISIAKKFPDLAEEVHSISPKDLRSYLAIECLSSESLPAAYEISYHYQVNRWDLLKKLPRKFIQQWAQSIIEQT